MITQIVRNALGMLLESKLMSQQDLANIAQMTEEQMHKLLEEDDQSVLTLEHVDNIVKFFGPAIFEEYFSANTVMPSGTQNVKLTDFSQGLKNHIELHKVLCAESDGIYTADLMAHKMYIEKLQDMISALNDPLPEGGSEWTIPAEKEQEQE